MCCVVAALLGQIPLFAEYFFARGVVRIVNALLNLITNYIPVSFYVVTVWLLVLGGVSYVVYLIFLLAKKKFKIAGLWIYRLVFAASCVLLSFLVLYSPLYNRNTVYGALGLNIKSVTQDEVYTAAEYFIDRLNSVSENIERDGEGNIKPPYSFSYTNILLNDEYNKINGGYFALYTVKAKQVTGEFMSYMGITGIYFPFYAEANVNINIPSYELPVVMAHEMAHAKGVAQENQANVTAYVICVRSDDIYLNYSGLMRVVANLVNNFSRDEYKALVSKIDGAVMTEYSNASAHYDKYEGWIDEVSSFFNDLFLKSNGVSGGTKSYSQTTKSIVALYYSLLTQ